ncbi:MAG: hypothetical protein ACI4XJ_11800 [Eubacteriales bacterium]
MIYLKRVETESTLDLSEDFVLPDYQPEVRRVIGVRANAYADGKYLSGEELEADGAMTYTVLYVGGDGEIAQVSETSSFTGHIPLKTEDDRLSPNDTILSVSADACTCRVTAPRKITLSSKVRLGLCSSRAAETSLKTDNAVVRRKTAEVSSAGAAEIRHNAEVSGEIREREGMRLVSAVGEICVSDVRFSGDGVSVKGDAYVNLLLSDPDGNYVTSRSRTPIDESVVLPDGFVPQKSSQQSGNAYTSSAAAFPSVTMTEVSLADDGLISWNMEYALDIDCIRKIRSEITDDAYLPDVEGEVLTTSELKVIGASGAASGRLTHQQSVKVKPDSTYVFAWGKGDIDKITLKDGRMCASGNVKISCVTENGGEYSIDESTAPFRYECEAMSDDGGENSDIRKTSVNVCDIIARHDGDEVSFTAELSVSVFALSEKVTPAVTEITPVEAAIAGKDKKNRSTIKIYVPDPDESSWAVEKKFRLGCPPEKNEGFYII